MSNKIDFSIATSEQIRVSLCGQVQNIRLARNVTQVQLARESGVSLRTIKKLEDGQGISRIHYPGFDRIKTLRTTSKHFYRTQPYARLNVSILKEKNGNEPDLLDRLMKTPRGPGVMNRSRSNDGCESYPLGK